MLTRLLIGLFLAATLPANAETDPAQVAESAVIALQEAAQNLAEANSSGDRVNALTKTIRAYEQGLSGLREGIRQAALRERQIEASIRSQESQLSSLLGALLSMQTSPEALALLHPAGPVQSARAGMILSDVSPILRREIADLESRLSELAIMRSLQDNAFSVLSESLAGAQEARTALSKAVQERRAPSNVSAIENATMQALVNSADTLQGFAASLATVQDGPDDIATGFSDFEGQLEPPVTGSVLTDFNRPDSNGIRRPGILMATAPGALVTTPHTATIRYTGPLLDLGNVSILEPESGYLLILSGLAQAFGQPGGIVEKGEAIGLMGGSTPAAEQILIESRDGSGQDRSETLYIELRKGETPLDPTNWFRLALE